MIKSRPLQIHSGCFRGQVTPKTGSVSRDNVEMLLLQRHVQQILSRQCHTAGPFREWKPDSGQTFIGTVHHFRADQPVCPCQIEIEIVGFPIVQQRPSNRLSHNFRGQSGPNHRDRISCER